MPSGDLHKSNAARKDAELQELRRVVAAKEKSIDSLRTQLATTKGSLEAYTQESEAILQQRDGEVQTGPVAIDYAITHFSIIAMQQVCLLSMHLCAMLPERRHHPCKHEAANVPGGHFPHA